MEQRSANILKLKNETSNIPIVMISGEEFREKALRAGADYFMAKPLEIKKLLRVIDSLLLQKNTI